MHNPKKRDSPLYIMYIPHFPAHKMHFFPQKCDLNSTCVLCAEGKYYFQTYKYPYIYCTTSLLWDSENNHEGDFNGGDDFLGFLWLINYIMVANFGM